MTQDASTQPVAETHKQRCPTDNSTQFYFMKEGLSYRCHRCKGIIVVSWEEILRQHKQLCQVEKNG